MYTLGDFSHSYLVTLFGTYLRLQLVGDLKPALQLDGRGPGSILKFDLGSAKFVPQNLNLAFEKNIAYESRYQNQEPILRLQLQCKRCSKLVECFYKSRRKCFCF
jgi:hypothetical protein